MFKCFKLFYVTRRRVSVIGVSCVGRILRLSFLNSFIFVTIVDVGDYCTLITLNDLKISAGFRVMYVE